MGGAVAASGSDPGKAPLIGPFGLRAIRLGRVLGIEVGIDLSWLFVFALVTLALAQQFSAEHEGLSPIGAAAGGLLGSLLLFLSILLHEFGHSLASRALGIPVRSITLFLFGGLARMSDDPRRPRDEFLIGIAGPVVSVLLGVVFLLVALALPGEPPWAELGGAACGWLGRINLFLAVFNCLPGYPLDGGHVLRAFVWAVTADRRLATSIAAGSGTILALALVGAGAFLTLALRLVSGLWLVLIGWFLLRAARGTALQALLEERLGRVPAGAAMVDGSPVVDGSETVADLVAGAILQRGERHFCVQEGGELTGLVTLQEIRGVPAEERATTRVASIMVPRSKLATISRDETLWAAMRRMDDLGVNQLPVTDGDLLVGMLTREQLLRVVRNQLDLGESDDGSTRRR